MWFPFSVGLAVSVVLSLVDPCRVVLAQDAMAVACAVEKVVDGISGRYERDDRVY